MRIFKTTTHKIILLVLVVVLTFNTAAFGYSYNTNRQEIESMIEEVATKRAIPPILMKAIAKLESSYAQFNTDGSPKITGDCIGLMMINNRNGGYNTQKLKYDIKYNIDAGADVLLNKWSMSAYNTVSSVGDMNPDVLENWYFALWAYNGWAQSNNPNMLPSYVKKCTYQQLIYNICKNEYNKNIENIDFSYLPQTGKPSRSLVVPTPANIHSGGIVLYEIGDFVRTDGVRSSYNLRDVPAGKYIHELYEDQLGTITEGPILKNGYYWYKVYVNDNIQGWMERNWLLRTGDIKSGRYIFNDMAFHWARKNIMELYNKGLISESLNFNPDKNISKEEFCIFLSKTLNLESASNDESTLPFTDKDTISPWALNYVANSYNAGLLNNYTDFKPHDILTRKEAALIFSNAFKDDNEYESLDINKIFLDINDLNSTEKAAIKKAYTQGMMSGKTTGSFCPNDYLTRAETATIMVKILENQID